MQQAEPVVEQALEQEERQGLALRKGRLGSCPMCGLGAQVRQVPEAVLRQEEALQQDN